MHCLRSPDLNPLAKVATGVALALLAATTLADGAQQRRAVAPANDVAVALVCSDSTLLPLAIRDGRGWLSLTDDVTYSKQTERAGEDVTRLLTLRGRNLPVHGWTFLGFHAASALQKIDLRRPSVKRGDHCTKAQRHCGSSLPPQSKNPSSTSRAFAPALQGTDATFRRVRFASDISAAGST